MVIKNKPKIPQNYFNILCDTIFTDSKSLLARLSNKLDQKGIKI